MASASCKFVHIWAGEGLLEKSLCYLSVASPLKMRLGECAGCTFLQMRFALTDSFKPGLAEGWRPVGRSRNKHWLSGFTDWLKTAQICRKSQHFIPAFPKWDPTAETAPEKFTPLNVLIRGETNVQKLGSNWITKCKLPWLDQESSARVLLNQKEGSNGWKREQLFI